MNSPTDAIRERAQKYDFQEVVKKIENSLDVVGRHLNGLRQDQADFKPSDAEWSVGEILHHVTDTTRGMLHICDKLHRKEEFKRPMERSDMGVTKRGVPVEMLRENWEAMRRDVRAKLATLTPPLNTEATRAHVNFGPLHSLEWLVLNYLHNHRHLAQIERVKAAAGFPQ